ncbi:DUF1292 domain-containing protein [Paenibacillus contaminans]|jgi:hypothetical protein|uniref:DUF1292 domain-containing protein n=1 Tax=Paenibacillus contaminans TaxID=450362 RepID=A0A329MQ79_9BACL|nr:DUF1292 domain-containing protein [Paenibacillus contaminans]RAV21914.1 DUF1292 domain-containing protein [Paenibacillus contaminans]
MISYTLKDVVPIRWLQETYGDTVELEGEGNRPEPFAILAEFSLGGTHYAVLQSESMQHLEEVAIYHIVKNDSGEYELDTIMDDDEYEAVAELFDEMTVSFDDGR